jgi:UDP-2,3-diacylglucosamine pyrophosphatase LpxH
LDNDPKNVAFQVVEPLKDISNLADEVIFVTGNHDEALEAFYGVYPIENPGFQISRRHYPREEPRYLQVGGQRYFFLHGYQFDKLFIVFGPFAKIPTIMVALNNILMRVVPFRGWFLPALLVFATFLSSTRNWPPIWIIYLLGILSVPRLFTYLQGRVWGKVGKYFIDKPKYKNISELVKKRYYKRNRDTILSDVVVSGHTHIPEISPSEISRELEKTFINTGSWVEDNNAAEKNTLLVIDKEGALLLAWKGEERGMEKLGSFPKL